MARGHIVAAGDVVDGRYRIERCIGKGGSAYVYRAVDTVKERVCALKLLRANRIDNERHVERFMKEARILAVLGEHPNIIEVFDSGWAAGETPYIATELLEGITLTKYIKRNTPAAWEIVLWLMRQIANGLTHAHGGGVVHRDLKPGNVLLMEDDAGKLRPKLLDFGIAKVLEMANDQSVTKVGTPIYCAPEQLGGSLRRGAEKVGVTIARGVSPATDVWPLGLICYELLTGLKATQYWGAGDLANVLVKSALKPRERPSEIAGKKRMFLPPNFDAWFMRCLHPNAEERFATPSEAVDALTVLLDLPEEEVPTLGPESPQLEQAAQAALGQMAQSGSASMPSASTTSSSMPSASTTLSSMLEPQRTSTSSMAPRDTMPPGATPGALALGSIAPPAAPARGRSSWVLVVAAMLFGAGAAIGASKLFGDPAEATRPASAVPLGATAAALAADVSPAAIVAVEAKTASPERSAQPPAGIDAGGANVDNLDEDLELPEPEPEPAKGRARKGHRAAPGPSAQPTAKAKAGAGAGAPKSKAKAKYEPDGI